ncbi:MAG: DUF2975 domain-containing protein [Ruminococcaceae bacterium]|nr:DUF2975 domain-containing protein [Oscillospiraceae bacterium]
MTQAALAKRLKSIIFGVGIFGLIFYQVVIPYLCIELFENTFDKLLLSILFLCSSGIPCYVVLFIAYRIADNIGKDLSFTNENAKLLKWISTLAMIDSTYLLIGNIVLIIIDAMNVMSFIILFMFVFLGVAISIVAAALSHLVAKAALLQSQNDLTI